MNDDWTKDIQRLMSDYEAKAPEGLLDDIKKEMARRGSFAQVSPKDSVEAKPLQKKNRVVPLWRYRWIAAAAAVAIIAVPVAYKLLSETKQQIAEVTKQATHATPSSIAKQTTPGSIAKQTMQGSIAKQTMQGSIAKQTEPLSQPSPLFADYSSSRSSRLRLPIPTEPSEAQSAAPLASSAPQEPQSSSQEPQNSPQKPKQQPRRYHPYPEDYSNDYASTEKHGSRGMTLTAYYGGSAGSGSTAGMPGGGMLMADGEPYGAYPVDMSSAYSAGFIGEKAQAPKRKAHHKQPIKVGVSIGYRLNDRWSVNTGVTYSYLSSDFTADNLPTETQKLHYVGIPVTASYSVVKSRKAEVYVAGGGEVEKLVKGTKSTENYVDEKVKEHRPQWSVNAAVGGAYHFTPTLSVYAEPGVSYHFDNHSAVDNVYKDRKTSFSLNVGLRFNVK